MNHVLLQRQMQSHNFINHFLLFTIYCFFGLILKNQSHVIFLMDVHERLTFDDVSRYAVRKWRRRFGCGVGPSVLSDFHRCWMEKVRETNPVGNSLYFESVDISGFSSPVLERHFPFTAFPLSLAFLYSSTFTYACLTGRESVGIHVDFIFNGLT